MDLVAKLFRRTPRRHHSSDIEYQSSGTPAPLAHSQCQRREHRDEPQAQSSDTEPQPQPPSSLEALMTFLMDSGFFLDGLCRR